MKIFAILALFASISQGQAQELAPHKDWSFREAGLIPVQSGGRIKPLDSFARDIVLFEVGSQKFEGWDPVDLLFSWISNPQAWVEKKFVKIGREDVRRQLALDEKRMLYSPAELATNVVLAQYAQGMGAPASGQKAHPRDQELRRVVDRLGTFRAIASGEAWLVVPRPVPEAWLSLAAEDVEGKFIRSQFVELVTTYKNGDPDGFARASTLARAAVEGSIPGWSEGVSRSIQVELLYNRAKPFRLAWILYLLAGVVYCLGLLRGRSGKLVTAGHVVTLFAFFIHIGGFAMRCYVAGRPPVTNMYESVIWVAFGTILFAGILYFMHRQITTMAVAAFVAAFALVAADSAPAMMDPSIQPLVPVLRSNYWLTIHVLTITLGYAAFALSLGLANVSLFHFLRPRSDSNAKIASINQLTYRAMQFGVVLLAAGTILGGVWADYSWGRFWGWDPKEVWALIALLCYLAILHARYTNWIGQFGFAAWTVLSFLSVMMAWYGVNFVLGVGLHSYGFSSGGGFWVALFIGGQILYVVMSAVRAKALQSRLRPPSPEPRPTP